MLDITEISRIGFGTYRIDNNSAEHEKALNSAINAGCNLIDTASNYMNGDSEKLVGKIINGLKKDNLFVVTKAGYISGENIKHLAKLNKKGKAMSDIITISEKFKHSIHPDYLNTQIEISLKRLNRKFLDGFLLHSPEYYFKAEHEKGISDEYYKRFKLAFEFLEDKVKDKTIRYYGVSSNVFTADNQVNPNTTNLNKLIEISEEVSLNNHFKLIQFPFNAWEKEASKAVYPGEVSLLEQAKKNGLITMGNRPLNANTPIGLIRLALRNLNEDEGRFLEDQDIFLRCKDLITKRLNEFDAECNIMDIEIMAFLESNWMKIENPESFKQIFNGKFYPFLNIIFNNEIPRNILNLIELFEKVCWRYHLISSSQRTIRFLKSNNLGYLLEGDKSLQYKVCEEYLNTGLNHVLVGMRSQAYVNDLIDLFKYPS